MEESTLLVNLAFALIAAFLGGFLAVRLGQSPILGFILGGLFIGPYTPGFVGDFESVEALADVGIILLLFTIGVQVSLKDLLRVGKIALFGGSIQVVLTIVIGYLAGIALGWQPLEALFFGAVISNSSSTVLSKVLGERGQEDSVQGRIALAWSTVQDLSTIVLVIILSALAGGDGNVVGDLIWAVVLAALFLGILFPLGSRFLPRFFERVAVVRSREIFIIAVAGFALGSAYLSTFFGLSLALGAFVAGVVVSESDLWHQILGEIMPLRDIFAALFFVSVGMFVDPVFVITHLPLVAVAVGLIIVAKGILVAIISLAFRYTIRTSFLIGITLAQSAEFSFLLASLGANLDAISSETFSLMLAGAVISIILAPALHHFGTPVADWLQEHFPMSKMSILPEEDENEPRMRGHAVICGYGRVGRVVGEALLRRELPFIVIEENRAIVQELRDRGIHALHGNADNIVLLEHAQLASARMLVLAVPDAFAARRAAEHAQQLNKRVNIVARSHSDRERRDLRKIGVDESIYAELEVALELTRFALNRFGVSSLEIQALLQRMRLGDDDD